jgi:hypothetical protein
LNAFRHGSGGFLLQVTDHHGGSGLGKEFGNAAPNASPTAGYDSDLTFEFKGV